jgi:branched-chain amino acid aminotransferase
VIISIDGELVPPERAVISVLDRGLLYGDGLFEVLRTWSGVPVELDAHLARLSAAASTIALRVSPHLGGWVLAAIAAAAAAANADVRVRVVVTRGAGALRERLADLPGGRGIVIVEPLPAAPPRETSLALVDFPIGALRSIKALAYLDHLLARELAAAAGADDAIRTDAAGDVAECATANLFIATAGAVATPLTDGGALPGIVRARVLAACARLGIPAAARRITVAELRAADEVFVTSSVRGVVSVTRLDGEPRAAGPLATRLAADHIAEMSALAAATRDRVLL